MNNDIRVGVFVCDCGTNIARTVNVPEVVEYAKSLNNVVFAEEGKWSCSVDYLAKLQEAIKEHNLNRVVIASCTPRTHEPLFKRTVKEAGLNPYLLEFVSIREQVSWVHMNDPVRATEKAKDLIKMGVAKAILLEPGEEIRLPVKQDCLIIGGGIAGMTAALNIAAQGFKAIIVEKQPQLGGLLNKLDRIAPEEVSADEIAKAKAELVVQNENIKVYTNAEIEDIRGYIGNYKVRVKTNGKSEEFDASTIIVATGMKEMEPVGQYGYGDDPRVITQLQLEALLKSNGLEAKKDVVIINCVNSKNEVRGCCNIGCLASVKNAMALKAVNKDTRVHILYRDLSMVKEEVNYLKDARNTGIKFIRYSEERKPEVSRGNGRLVVKVYDILLGRELNLPADLIVLTTAFEGDSTVDKLKGLLKVSTNSDGFFQEAHVKLGPSDFASDGLYLCGCARSPKNVKDATEEAMGAAMRASIPMKTGYLEAEGIVSDIDLEACNNCGLCVKNCPYGAIQLVDDKPDVIKALCKGCGLCAADCTKDAITIVHYSDEQILAQVEAALQEKAQEKIIAFCCHWCALGAVDMAGVSRLQYPPNVRVIRVMCSARVATKFVLRAFELGAAGVLVAGCEFPTCHYIVGNYKAEKRMERIVKKRLAQKGYDPDKLWTVWLSATDGPKFAATIRAMVEQLNLG
jgi:heterodisulfide reductase subunit A